MPVTLPATLHRLRALGPTLLLGLVALIPFGCGEGEITDLQLIVRPRLDDFQQTIQPLVQQMGCSPEGGGCHNTQIGGFIFTPNPDAAAADTNYKSMRDKVLLDDAANSDFLIAIIEGSSSNHFPKCISTDDCAYVQILAWINGDSTGDDLANLCDSSGDSCF